MEYPPGYLKLLQEKMKKKQPPGTPPVPDIPGFEGVVPPQSLPPLNMARSLPPAPMSANVPGGFLSMLAPPTPQLPPPVSASAVPMPNPGLGPSQPDQGAAPALYPGWLQNLLAPVSGIPNQAQSWVNLIGQKEAAPAAPANTEPYGPQTPAAPETPPGPTGPDAAQQAAIADAAREVQKRKLRGMKDIAEGLGNIRFHARPVFVSLEGGAREGADVADSTPPYRAESIRQDLSDLEDQLSSTEAAPLEKMLDLPVGSLSGARYSQIARAFPAAAGIIKQGRNEVSGIVKMYNGNPAVVQAEKSRFGATQALAAMDTGTSTGDMSAVVLAARSSGDMRISNQDIQRWLNPFGYKSLEEMLVRFSTGRMSPEHQQALRSVLKSIQRTAETEKQAVAKQIAGQMAGSMGRSPSELYKMLVPEGDMAPAASATAPTPPAPPPAGTVPMRDGSRSFNIPIGALDEFKRDHPNAVPANG